MSMKWDDTGLKTPLARARGLGSARSAVGHWFNHRVSAVANVFLSIWFIWFLTGIIGADHAQMTQELADPRNAIAMILLVISVFYHATSGVREVIEDYVHIEWFKMLKLIGSKLFFFAAGVACIFSVLKIAFTVGM